MLTQVYGLLAVDSSRLSVGSFSHMLLSYMIMRKSYNYRLGGATRWGQGNILIVCCCLLPGLSSGLLGDETVDNLAGLAFWGILGGGEAGAAGGP